MDKVGKYFNLLQFAQRERMIRFALELIDLIIQLESLTDTRLWIKTELSHNSNVLSVTNSNIFFVSNGNKSKLIKETYFALI